MSNVYEVLRQKIKLQSGPIEEVILNGDCKSYDEYKKLVGVLQGLSLSLAEINDLAAIQDDDYD